MHGTLEMENYGDEYRAGDIVTMIYNPYKATLVFDVMVKQNVIENIYANKHYHTDCVFIWVISNIKV